MNETLSVVMPVYNGADYLEDAIKSVLQQNQSIFKINIIAVNDGSTDHSLNLLKTLADQHPELSLINLPKNQGVAAARNAGVIEATTKWLSFIDQDDCWDLDKLTTQFQYLSENPDCDFVIALQKLHLVKNKNKPSWAKTEWLEKPQPGYLFGNTLIQKNNFLKVGLLNPDIRQGVDDVDWFIRAEQKGLKHHMIDHPLLYRKVHDRNFSSETKAANQALLSIIRAKLKGATSHA